MQTYQSVVFAGGGNRRVGQAGGVVTAIVHLFQPAEPSRRMVREAWENCLFKASVTASSTGSQMRFVQE